MCLFALVAAAQTPDTATLRGSVIDQTHAAVTMVQVTVTNTLTGLKRTAQTDGSGNYAIGGLPIGSYDVVASKQGFAEMKPAAVTLAGGTTVDVDLQLNAAGGTTQVTVTGAVGEVRTDGPQLGDRLDAQQMEETPLLNRRITYLPLLNAANRQAINQGDVFMNEDMFTTNGAGRRQTWFEIDGANGNDSWGRQTMFSNLPLDAVQEMTILNNGFSAEYGASTGSAVNIITKSRRQPVFTASLWNCGGHRLLAAALSGFNVGNGGQRKRHCQRRAGAKRPVALRAARLEDPFLPLRRKFSRETKGSPIISPLDPTVV